MKLFFNKFFNKNSDKRVDKNFDKTLKAVELLQRTLNKRHKLRKVYRTVFVDDKNVQFDDKETVNLILSPKYYWVKSEKLPIKYAFQAREYAPALFDGYIPEGDYSYKVVKQGDKFLVFAYDIKDILENLEKLGVKMSQVDKVYFAQTEFGNRDKPIKIDKENALIARNDKVVKAPLYLLGDYVTIGSELKNLTPSKHYVKLGKFNRYYEHKGAFGGIIYVLLFFIVLFLGEIVYLSKVISAQNVQKDNVAKRYSLPSTDVQLKAIMKQYDGINKRQREIRDKLNYVFKFQLLEDEHFKNIEANAQGLSLILYTNDKSRAEIANNYFKKSFIVDEVKEDGSNIKIKMRYE